MLDVLVQIILASLVVILAVLLYVRQKQIKGMKPPTNLEDVLATMQENIISNRSEGKIQKVASQLSDILIKNLYSERILFFRKQRRFMEMNYVYGLKNIKRAKYRIKISHALLDKLVDPKLIHDPKDFEDLLGTDVSGLLEAGKFNIAFPIFWQDTIFGLYLISTPLTATHPLVKTLLMFLSQNLSAAYHIKRLESSRQILEKKIESSQKQAAGQAKKAKNGRDSDEDPGHLIEMFRHHNVEELLTNLFDKVKTGLQADKLIFVAPASRDSKKGFNYSLGIDGTQFQLDGKAFERLYGSLSKQEVYNLDRLGKMPRTADIKESLEKNNLSNVTPFSLSENEPGVLIWSGKLDTSGDVSGVRLLSRFEKIARRAMVNARQFERLEAMTYTDALTHLYNHRYFVKRLHEEIKRAKRYQRTLGLLLFDIDDFKLYNDSFGHQCGDDLLRRMGSTLERTLRSIDIVSRYGGDEFCIIMPEADKTTCRVFMDRLRHAIAETDFRDKTNGFEGRVTISVGSAIYPHDAETVDRLIYCADMALLRSKALGRNCSTVYEPELSR